MQCTCFFFLPLFSLSLSLSPYLSLWSLPLARLSIFFHLNCIRCETAIEPTGKRHGVVRACLARVRLEPFSWTRRRFRQRFEKRKKLPLKVLTSLPLPLPPSLPSPLPGRRPAILKRRRKCFHATIYTSLFPTVSKRSSPCSLLESHSAPRF